jgi:hypothetical protein
MRFSGGRNLTWYSLTRAGWTRQRQGLRRPIGPSRAPTTATHDMRLSNQPSPLFALLLCRYLPCCCAAIYHVVVPLLALLLCRYLPCCCAATCPVVVPLLALLLCRYLPCCCAAICPVVVPLLALLLCTHLRHNSVSGAWQGCGVTGLVPLDSDVT